MGGDQAPTIGTIAWRDLRVEKAEAIRDFFCRVVGWESTSLDMGECSDFNTNLPASGETVTGICHARGSSAQPSAHWLIYITVENADNSAQPCEDLGGRILSSPRTMGRFRVCVIQGPAGEVAALISNA